MSVLVSFLRCGHAMALLVLAALTGIFVSPLRSTAAELKISEVRRAAADFPIVDRGGATPLAVDSADAEVVRIAANLFASDVEAVSGVRPLLTNTPSAAQQAVIAGTIGTSPLIDELIQRGVVDVTDIRGGWERFKIQVVNNPFPGLNRALVIAGSDRRGTAYGVLSLSEAIGVSPWCWWADVTPDRRAELFLSNDTFVSPEPAVRYRGIFINDEDWGLHPWARNTFEKKGVDGIGPKTYTKVFELLLRLKANTLWPAMHACTKPFNANPEHRKLADAHAIVMGSSHAEPMLRNNVREWTAPAAEYNYQTHSNKVRGYWEERVRESGQSENIYTLGMRGIHDSRMQGPRGRSEQIKLLEQIMHDQRELIRQHVSTNVTSVPQVFCAYKEVLDLYRGGLRIPDDVTIMFPDDNFGYLRMLPRPEERTRNGGFGAYYHISYLGRPLSYLWLCTTPPALIWEEMSKAYDHGVRQMWIVNAGDIKPGEIGTEFFLKLAWNAGQWNATNVHDFLSGCAARDFGRQHAGEIADLMDRYYRLNHQRKPEHLQWWLPNEQPRPSSLAEAEIQGRLQAFADLESAAARAGKALPPHKQDAYFQLVYYPIAGSALANRRYFLGERGSPEAAAADAQLKELTRRYNEEIAAGKWRHFMALEPADNDWRGMRIAPWEPRTLRRTEHTNSGPASYRIEAEDFQKRSEGAGARWEIIRGLGPSGDSVAVFPTTAATRDPRTNSATVPSLSYEFDPIEGGEFEITFWMAPTFPISGSTLRIAVALNSDTPRLVELPRRDGSPEWAAGVLEAAVPLRTKLGALPPGKHELRIFMVDAGVVLDRIEITPTAKAQQQTK